MDTMKIRILPDGRIKIETDRFSPAVHSEADRFVKDCAHLMGGKVDARHKPGSHGHEHTHGEGHAHSHA